MDEKKEPDQNLKRHPEDKFLQKKKVGIKITFLDGGKIKAVPTKDPLTRISFSSTRHAEQIRR